MTVRLGADGESSNVAELRALGATFISRYLSDFPSKNLTLAEATTLSNAGIDVVSNWEDGTSDWQGGYAAGVRNAQVAWAQHKACGGPDGRPIYFSIDTDVNPQDATLHAYFQGLGAGMTPGQIGVYGSTGVCLALKAAGLVSWTWRTMSTGWTGGGGDPSEFNVEQTGYFNNTYDRDASITDDFGQWRVGQPPSPTPVPTPSGSDDLVGSALISAAIPGQFPDLPDMAAKFPPNTLADVPNAVVWADARAAAAAEYAKQARDLLVQVQASVASLEASVAAVKLKLGA